MVTLDRCNASCNSFDDPSDKICVPHKTEIYKYKFKRFFELTFLKKKN